jgi:single-strand DNA-binding protein
MAGSVNKVILVGNVGQDPEIRSMQSGDRVANLSIATSETWKDKSGERQEKTQWHKIVVFNQNIVNVIDSYVTKGSKIFVEGQLETRKWDNKEGVTQYMTEIVIKPFNGSLTMLDSKGDKVIKEREYETDDSGDIPY